MNEPFIYSNESFLHIGKWQKRNPKLKVGFTTRNGGVSEPPFDTLNCGLHVPDEYQNVIMNRKIVAEKWTIPIENWVSGEQTHSTNVMEITDDDKGKGAATYQSSIKGTDGLITNKTGIVCTAFFADCVPLFFFDPESGYIGIAHAGWKGTVNNMAEVMVQRLESAGVNNTDLLVTIGPCISQPIYEVDTKVIQSIDEKYFEKTVDRKSVV